MPPRPRPGIPMKTRKCAFLRIRARPDPADRGQMVATSRPAAMPRIELDLPPVISDALNDAAASAGIPPAELLVEALRCLPAFQRALAARPERLSAFATDLRS